MANIQEYLPQVEAQGPVGGVSPNIELSGAMGAGIQRLGSAIGEGADLIHRRNAQEETADVYAAVSDQRSQQYQKLQEQIQDGSLDTEKFAEQYDQSMQGMGDKLNTPEARNFFERQQARLKGQLLKTATQGAAVMAKNNAMAAWQTGMDGSSNALEHDPSSFDDVKDSGAEAVDELIKNQGLPESLRGKLTNEMNAKYSMAAIRGWAQLDPDEARKRLSNGDYDNYLTNDQKHQMGAEIDRYERAHTIEGERSDKAQEDARKKNYEKWGQDHLEALTSNSLSTKDVMGAVKDGTMTWENGERWMKMIQEGAKQELKTDPRIKNQLIQRITDPQAHNPIDTVEDLMPYVGKGISIQDFNQMNSLLNKTPDQQAQHQSEKALFQSAKSAIRFKNPMTMQSDLLGEQKLAKFMSDYTQAKKDTLSKGGNVQDLLDPNNPTSFYNRMSGYTTSMQDQMTHVSQDRTDKALGLRPSNSNPDAKPTDKNVRKPNESAAEYLKRVKPGG